MVRHTHITAYLLVLIVYLIHLQKQQEVIDTDYVSAHEMSHTSLSTHSNQ